MSQSIKKSSSILIAGAGGFIGGHLVKYFLKRGYSKVRAVDIKSLEDWYQVDQRAKNLRLDLREKSNCEQAVKGVKEVYNLAANMGGIGFIENHKVECMLSVLINTHLLMAAHQQEVERYFFSSSACVYAANKQTDPAHAKLKESDAYPAQPEDGYGWEKLFSERMCRHFREDLGLETKVARFHNVYGPYGAYEGGREKAPAALTRKVIQAKLSDDHQIKIWGDGQQVRTFMDIDDCVKGIDLIMHSDLQQPVNLGTEELVTINQLVDIIEELAQVELDRHYQLDAPKGVRGRSSDNSLLRHALSWEPSIPLREGMAKLYNWIYQEMTKNDQPPVK